MLFVLVFVYCFQTWPHWVEQEWACLLLKLWKAKLQKRLSVYGEGPNMDSRGDNSSEALNDASACPAHFSPGLIRVESVIYHSYCITSTFCDKSGTL